MATKPDLPGLRAAGKRRSSTRGSRSRTRTTEAIATSRFRRQQDYAFRPSADLAGRALSLSTDIPAVFDEPLAAHHKLIGSWIAAREASPKRYTRFAARRHIERCFDAAVLAVLEPLEFADFRVAVLHSESEGPPAIAIICESLGQLDLGWIETGDAPIPWRAAAYRALEQTLGYPLPIFGYQDLFDEISVYYWDGEIEDEAARQSLIAYHGLSDGELEQQTLPSEMNARRPEWMIGANAPDRKELPAWLRTKLRSLSAAYKALKKVPPERNAWRFDPQTLYEYIPGVEECSHLPPLTLVPFEHFSRELDDVARSGMEMGFMDVAGLCPLSDTASIDHWFNSLRLGADFLLAAQDLTRVDPSNL